MAIYDVTKAGTYSEIGSAAYDITKAGVLYPLNTMYDVTRAGTYSNVWQSEVQIYPGAAVNTTTAYGDRGSGGTWYVSMSTDQGNSSSVQRYIAVNVTPYRQLRITGQMYATGTRGAWAGFYMHTSPYYPYYIFIQNTNNTRQASVATGGSSTGPWIWDVSGLSGTYYIYAVCYLETALSANMYVRIDSVIGI